MIQELHSIEIDKSKWDHTVLSDANGKVYSMSWYLDAVTNDNWNGLITGDYESVMPFVQGQKFGIRYCYMPYFVQQFSIPNGVFYLPEFIKHLQKRYSYGQLAFTGTDCKLEGYAENRNNFELSLNKSYMLLQESFSSNHKTNINRFKKGNCAIAQSEEISHLIKLLAEEKSSVFQAKELNGISVNIQRIYEAAAKKGLARLFFASDKDGIVGGAFFVEHNNRLYYLLGISKRKLAHSQSVSYGLLDYIIKEYAGRAMVLDFEGSQIESISYFFKGFGAVNHPYTMIKWNDLPFFIKWIKR